MEEHRGQGQPVIGAYSLKSIHGLPNGRDHLKSGWSRIWVSERTAIPQRPSRFQVTHEIITNDTVVVMEFAGSWKKIRNFHHKDDHRWKDQKAGNWVSFHIGIEVITEYDTCNGSITSIPPIPSVVSMRTANPFINWVRVLVYTQSYSHCPSKEHSRIQIC